MNDRLVTEIRRAMAELADATPPTPPLDELLAARQAPLPPHRPRRLTFAAVAVSLAVAVAGLVFVRSHVDTDRRGDDTPTTTTAPVNTSTATTAAPTATTAATQGTTPAPTTTTVAPPPAVGPPDAALATGFEPASITWISLQQGWLLGHAPCATGSCLSLARTRDGGQTWHGVPAPDITASSVRFADSRNGWIFGVDLYATHDGGSTWKKVNGLSLVNSLEVAKGRAWAEAEWIEQPGNKVVYTSLTTTDDWHQIDPMPVSTPIAMHGGTGWVVGADGGLFVLTATGFEIHTDPCPFESAIGAILGVDDQTVAVVCGSDSAAGSESKQGQLSHGGGHDDYTIVGEAPRGGILGGGAVASPTTWVIAATSGASFLYRTTDAGATWTTVFEDGSGGAPITDLGFTDATHGIAVLGTQPSVLLTTTDGGATWKKTAIHE
jgi:photosystem II stability/assembly factor-like uncharacterized protein